MIVIQTVAEWRSYLNTIQNHTLGFVPTMGALHGGHLSLVQSSKKHNNKTLVSIFVNPTQFNNNEDFDKYPRIIDKDLDILNNSGVDYVFTPSVQDIYPSGFRFFVNENAISREMEGEFRPGHFSGVLTIMMKLLNIISPTVCYMGEKDYQQYLLVRDLAAEFFVNCKIVSCPTVRESSGLAMSSRNLRLSDSGLKQASLIYSTITNPAISLEQMKHALEAAGIKTEYITEKWGRRLIAAQIEGVRLIDNVAIPVSSPLNTQTVEHL